MKLSLGTILTVSGTTLTTGYTVGSTSAAQNGGRSDRLRLTFLLTTIGGTVITGLTYKARASKDGVTFYDVLSNDDTAPGLQTEYTKALAVAGTPQQFSMYTDGGYLYYQVLVHATGGAGQAGESVTVDAEAM